MKRISILLILSLYCSLSFAQTNAWKEGVERPSSRSLFNGQEPDIIPKSARNNVMRLSSVQTTSEQQAEHDGHDHAPGEPCGTVEYNTELRKRYKSMSSDSEFETFLQRLGTKNISRSGAMKKNAAGEAVYQIPIIIHVVYFPGEAIGTGHNLSKEAIYSQIDVLNEDYRRKMNTRGYNNLSVGADTKIEFIKALYAPDGTLLPEPGIHRINASTITDGTSVLGLTNTFFSQATADWIKENTFWEPNCYANIWVMGIAKPLLGYSIFPDVNLPGIAEYDLDHTATRDGVVIDYRRFGTQERGPFVQIEDDSYGRTPTHELGHFLGLRHTFGDAPIDAYGQRPEGCKYDDFVTDTPNQKNEMRGGVPLYLCGEREMVENYMGYSPEQGMNVFTKGQVERMHKVLENSPRRKELLTSTVASTSGDKTPLVTIKASATTLFVLDLFSFEAYVERFPGTYTWTFEDGVPATSTKRNAGAYFTSTGVKQVTLTVDNAHAAVTQKMYVTIKDVESCMPQYSSTLASLQRLSGSAIAPGNYVTGHANVWGYKVLGNRFTRSTSSGMKAISQLEMEISRFYINETVGTYNPNALVKFYVMAETYDSLRMMMASSSNNYRLYKKGVMSPHTQYTLTRGELDTLAMAYKLTPEVVPWYNDATPNLFIARKNRPGDTLATAYVRVGDIQKALESITGKLVVKLDNPVWPTTENYYILVDLDYDYYSTYRRPYSFEFNTGLSPSNFAWVYSTITTQNAAIDPNTNTYIQEWKPFSEPTYANSWGTSALIGLLPIYTADTTAISKPDVRLSANEVMVGEQVTAYLDGVKPSNMSKYRWAITKEDGSRSTFENKDSISYTFSTPGRYNVTLTYEDHDCLQRSTTKKVTVKGIRFHLVNSTNQGIPLSCGTAGTRGTVTLNVIEDFKSGTGVTYTWSGGSLSGTGVSKSVTPGTTTTYYVTAVDNLDASITARDSIKIVVNTLNPVAKFDVTYPHLRRGDTLDIYVTGGNFTAINRSENVSSYIVSGKEVKPAHWFIEKPSSPLFSEGASSTAWDMKTNLTSLAKTGPGLYRMSLRACNMLCNTIPFVAGVTKVDTAIVYLNFLGLQNFGALEIRGNGTSLPLGTTPPGYENSRGSYYAYVPTGGSIKLEAVSNEITSISWTNSYSGQVHTATSIDVTDVRDVTKFTVSVVRKRNNGQSTINLSEELVVILYPESYRPTKRAVPLFTLSADSVCVGSKIKFENSSTNAIDFKWEFNGGESAEDVALYGYENLWKPTRVYNQGGTFTAKLTVTSYDGSSSSYEREVHVVPANNPRMVYAVTSSLGMVRNDTLFAPSGYGASVGISGYGLKGLYSSGTTITGVRTEFYRQATDPLPLTWQWSDHPASSIKGMVFTATYRTTNIDATAPTRLPRIAIDALACDGVTHIYDTLYVRLVPARDMNLFSLTVNGQALQLGDQQTLSPQSLCPGQVLNMQLDCSNADSKATTIVRWYELNDAGDPILVGNGYNFSTTPTKNATFWVNATNMLRQDFTYAIPVVIGVTAQNIQVKNQDLTMTGDTLKLPQGYGSDVILQINGLINPQWRKVGSSTVLSQTNALVVVSPEGENSYEVSAVSPSGGCSYAVRLTVTKPANLIPKPDDVPVDDDTKAIEMYPIPAREVLNIESPYDGDAYIVSGNGQVVKQFRLQAGKLSLPLSGMSAGVYRLVVQQAKGGKIISRNFVVVR